MLNENRTHKAKQKKTRAYNSKTRKQQSWRTFCFVLAIWIFFIQWQNRLVRN